MRFSQPISATVASFQPTARRYYMVQVCPQPQVYSLFPHSHNPLERLPDMTGERSGASLMAFHAFSRLGGLDPNI